ncbi:MAG TPA: hypothetical protein ENF42_01945, partial [Candidatus Bathyarchaeota archaeon]|nr:hypothetical protein [Candidatus Bathyarchaeota archaeon]
TSYEHYIRALCEAISFPFSNTYCTRLSIDRYDINDSEATRLRELASEIRDMPVVEIPEDAESIDDLKVEHQAVIKRLDEIFWREISKMRIGGIFRDVNPVGGYEKAKAVRDISSKLNVKLSEVIYVGDSITDVESFRLVRKGGGLTISFNGNAYAVREAEVAVLSSHTVTISILADVFNRGGKERVLELVEDWSIEKIRSLCGSRLADALYKVSKRHPVKVELITPKNMKRLMHESSSFRKNVRGEAVGALG